MLLLVFVNSFKILQYVNINLICDANYILLISHVILITY